MMQHKNRFYMLSKKIPLSNYFIAFANGNGQAKYTVFTSRIRVCWLFLDVFHSLGAKHRNDSSLKSEYFLFFHTTPGDLKTEVSP